jgi:putative DNA primase/helicase
MWMDGWIDDPKLRVLDVARMLATDSPPVPWAVEPLLAEGCVTMLAGREGQGKSMLALALAAAVGHGATVAGLACRPGRTLVVDAENGEREAHRRVRGLGVKPGTLIYAEAVGGFNLAQDIGLIAKLVDEHRPSLLVLDSLRSLAPGLDENDSRPVEAALRPVSRLAQDKGIPVLLLHHAGKHGAEYRGSTAIGAAVELGFTLSRREEDPEKPTRRRLACWKSRPAPEPRVAVDQPRVT